MNFRKILILISTIILAIFVFWYISTRVYSLAGNKIIPVNIKNNKFYVETVLSQEKMEKGLGGRNDLCLSCGMLFKFQKVGKYSFWMKNMIFPLDIVWLLQNKVVHIEKNIKPDFVGVLSPLKVADSVLEINAGKIDDFGIKIGDMVNF